MRSNKLLLAGGALLLSACASLIGVFVSRSDAIRIPHERHTKAEVECGTCHETIFESATLQTVDLPKEKLCLKCHAEEKQKGNCGFCHTDAEHPQTFPVRVRDLKMNHAEHIERVKEDCKVCHQQLPEPLRTEKLAPKMATCLGCHEHAEQYAAGKCEVCHQDLSKFPLKPIADFSHRGDFLRDHRLEARSAGAACATCHEQSFCSSCHAKTQGVKTEVLLAERVDRSFIHRNDFFSRHPVEAKADPALCLRCHGVDSCNGCHQKNGLGAGNGATLDPHPAGFSNGMLHGPEARRDIVSCAACHDQGAASTCVQCHRVGGVGGNPHPPSWAVRHRKEEIGRNAMCQICHL